MRDALATKLTSDSTEMAAKIEKYKINETLYKANEADFKAAAKNGTAIQGELKKELSQVRIDLNYEKDKSKRRGGIIIGSVSLNIVFIVIGAGIIFLK